MKSSGCRAIGGLLLVLAVTHCQAEQSAKPGAAAAVVATLTPANAASLAPGGREADWIYGDVVLRNEHLTAVIARPSPERHANWVIRDAGCALIDLSERADANDLLGIFRPGGEGLEYRAAPGQSLDLEVEQSAAGAVPTFRCVAAGTSQRPEVSLEYRLVGDALEVETLYLNVAATAMVVPLRDQLRAEETFQKRGNAHGKGEARSFWVYDRHSRQAYGVSADDHTIRFESDWRTSTLHYQRGAASEVRLEPRQAYRLVRRVRAATHLLELRSQIQRGEGMLLHDLKVSISDAAGPLEGVDVTLIGAAGERLGAGRSDGSGALDLALPGGTYQLQAEALGRGRREATLTVPGPASLALAMPAASVVEALVRDGANLPIAAKLQFIGVKGTPSPNFGPAQGDHALRNVYYTSDGRMRQPLAPGRYRLIASHGPEYDAFQRTIDVAPGEVTTLSIQLVRSVASEGWVSADMHSHTTESGDTAASRRGRVLNLLAEHIEFAPATEHNRISSHEASLAELVAEAQMATVGGVELTGAIPMNHQNAFPLSPRVRTQDGGAPMAGDPEDQIRRLAAFDGEREKLLQQNHPDLSQILHDRDQDGVADAGYRGMLPYIDVMEIYPLARFLNQEHGDEKTSPMIRWLALLNRGLRIPAVINTDAHSNFHGSGPRRTYIRSESDDPSAIDPLELVAALKRGRAVMTTGPYLEVAISPSGSDPSVAAIPGDDLTAPGGAVEVSVRVQCPNWFDVDRVQLLLNGRMPQELDFRRVSSPERFSDSNVRFASVIPLQLVRDTHVVVLTVGHESRLGLVMGQQNAGIKPVAVSNPIFIDVDGDGFEPNFDSLDVEWPEGAIWPEDWN